MSQVEESLREHEERCAEQLPNKFVTWKWLVSIIIGSVITLVTVSWCLSSSMAAVQHKIREHTKRIDKIEEIYEDVKWIRKKLEK